MNSQRLKYEAKIWSQLEHPHILPFLGTCKLDDWMCMVSPWQQHGSLSAWTREPGRTDPERLTLVRRICSTARFLTDRQNFIAFSGCRSP